MKQVVEIRQDGWMYKAVRTNLGGNGTNYWKYNGGWKFTCAADMPKSAYRAIRKALAEDLKKGIQQ